MLSPDAIEGLEASPGRVIVAYSGGCDSHVLLHYLAAALNRSVEALHINHGLHAEADSWQEHCEQVCDSLNVPLTSFAVEVDRSGSLETNAREARYLVFEQFLESGDRLLLAHHQDDQIETLFLNLTSGRAPLGLLGMPQQRSCGFGTIERPCLKEPQQTLLDYAEAQGLVWIEDPSNQDTQHTRNLIRHEVMPILKSHWPDINSRLESALDHTAEVMNGLEAQATMDLEAMQNGPGVLDLNSLRSLTEVRRHGCLRQFLAQVGYTKLPSQKTLKEMEKVLLFHSSGFDLGEWFLQSHDQKLYLSQQVDLQQEAVVPLQGQAFSGGFVSANITKGQGLSVPANQLRCQIRLGGESILKRGHHHKLKNLFQENRYPPHVRNHVPLIWLDDVCVGVCGIPDWGIQGVVADEYCVADDEFGCELDWTPAGL